MDKYKRYYGVGLFVAVVVLSLYMGYNFILPKVDELNSMNSQLEQKQGTLEAKQKEMAVVKGKIKKLRESNSGAQKKIYSPVESNLEDDTLFFTLYNDVIEMIHANSIKIKSINYTYNPKDDKFVEFGKDVYFVCDVNMELVSNYTNLGKLIEEIYQYPYYIKINELSIKPYEKDKKVLITELSLRLYAHTEPADELATGTTDTSVGEALPEI